MTTIDLSQMKLGKLPYKHDDRTLFLDSYIDSSKLPPPPSTYDYGTAVQSWPMYDNDRLGDCTCAGVAHQVQSWTQAADDPFTPDDSAVLSMYSAVSGYDPTTGANDNGAVELDVLNYWRNTGLEGHKIGGFVGVNIRSIFQTRVAAWLFGGLYIGIQLPLAFQSQGVQWNTKGYSPTDPRWQAGSWGGHCLAPGTRVLTDDLRWVPIEDVLVGEGLLGFDEDNGGLDGNRRYRRSVVEATEVITLPCYEVTFEDGTTMVASDDHRWLTADGPNFWRRTDTLRPGRTKVLKPLETWDTDESRDAGYLAAAFDGEGWIDGEKARAIHKIGFAQRDNEMWDHTLHALKERGFDVAQWTTKKGGYPGSGMVNQLEVRHRQQVLEFLGSIRPHRLLAKFNPDRLGAMYSRHIRVEDVRPVGEREVVALQTTSRTFVAEGFAAHNCVVITGYDSTGYDFVSWGQEGKMTVSALHLFVDEVWGIVSSDFFDQKTGSTPEGLNIAQLNADLSKFGHPL